MAGIERRWWLTAFAGSLLASGALAGGASFGPKWTYSSGNQFWIPSSVSLGDRGGQVLLQLGQGYDSTRLFSAHDWDPPTPVWQVSEGQPTYTSRTASADDRDLHVTLHDAAGAQAGSRRLVLRRYSSASSVPLWSYGFPGSIGTHDIFDVVVSRDGTRIVTVLYDLAGGRAVITTFGADSSSPSQSTSVPMQGFLRNVRLSPDGSKLYLASDIRILIVETATGVVDHTMPIFDLVNDAHAIAAGGQYFAYGIYGGAKLYRRSAQGYELAFQYSLPPTWVGRSVSLSDDGGVLVVGLYDSATTRTLRIVTIDVFTSIAQGSAVVMASDEVTGGGSYGNNIADMELSSDGSRLAVGSWGDEQGLAPEVLVYDTSSSTPLASYDLPGSVRSLDLSADGTTLVVASKRVHNNVLGNGGRVDLFDLSSGDLVLRGQPRSGQSVRIELTGTPGSEAHLLWSGTPAGRGVVYPGIGTLQLDRESIAEISMGFCDAAERAQADFVIPPGAPGVPVGQTLYLQGLTLGPRTLTETWIEVTVLP